MIIGIYSLIFVEIELNFSRHPEPHSSFRRRSSMIDFPQTSPRRSSLAFRKNEQVHTDNTRRLSLLELQANGELNKNLKNLVVKVSLFQFSLKIIYSILFLV